MGFSLQLVRCPPDINASYPSVIAELGEGEFASVGPEKRGFLYRLLAGGLHRLGIGWYAWPIDRLLVPPVSLYPAR